MRALLQSFLSTVSLDMDICAQKPGLLSPSNIYSTIFSSPVSYCRGGGVCPWSVVRGPWSVVRGLSVNFFLSAARSQT